MHCQHPRWCPQIHIFKTKKQSPFGVRMYNIVWVPRGYEKLGCLLWPWEAIEDIKQGSRATWWRHGLLCFCCVLLLGVCPHLFSLDKMFWLLNGEGSSGSRSRRKPGHLTSPEQQLCTVPTWCDGSNEAAINRGESPGWASRV